MERDNFFPRRKIREFSFRWNISRREYLPRWNSQLRASPPSHRHTGYPRDAERATRRFARDKGRRVSPGGMKIGPKWKWNGLGNLENNLETSDIIEIR